MAVTPTRAGTPKQRLQPHKLRDLSAKITTATEGPTAQHKRQLEHQRTLRAGTPALAEITLKEGMLTIAETPAT